MMGRDVTSKEKAAILMIMLGKEHAAKLYKYLTEEEIEQLTLAITSVQHVESEVKDQVLSEFLDICVAQKFISEGGISYASDVLHHAFGDEKAQNLIRKLTSSLRVKPFDFINKVDSTQVYSFIQNEHSQTIALVLSYLDPKQSAEVLSSLPIEKQTAVISGIANMTVAAPEYIKEVERILERNISTVNQGAQTSVGGVDSLVPILNSIDRSTEKALLSNLGEYNPDLAEEIRSKMFVFEDLVKLDDRAIQTVLKQVHNDDLSIALKGATTEVETKIFNNMSKRLKEVIKENIEFLGPVRVKDVEEAQQKIVNVIRSLDESGEIIISRGKEDALIV